jgi:hypothetical protein
MIKNLKPGSVVICLPNSRGYLQNRIVELKGREFLKEVTLISPPTQEHISRALADPIFYKLEREKSQIEFDHAWLEANAQWTVEGYQRDLLGLTAHIEKLTGQKYHGPTGFDFLSYRGQQEML